MLEATANFYVDAVDIFRWCNSCRCTVVLDGKDRELRPHTTKLPLPHFFQEENQNGILSFFFVKNNDLTGF